MLYISVSCGGQPGYVAQEAARQLANGYTDNAKEAAVATRIAAGIAESCAALPANASVSLSFSGSVVVQDGV